MQQVDHSMVKNQEAFHEVGDLAWSVRASKSKWLACDGAAVSRTTYAALFAQVGTTFGAGDGTTTFNVPDGRGRAMVASGQGATLTNRALGASGGAETHTLASAEMPSHRHRLYGNGGSGGTGPTGLGDSLSRPVAGNTNASGNGYVDANNATPIVENTGGGGAHNNMQPFIAANLFIYAGV